MRSVALGGAVAVVIAGCAAHTQTVTVRAPAQTQTMAVGTASPPTTPSTPPVAPAPPRHNSCVAYYRTRVLVRFHSGTGDMRRACLAWVDAPAHRGRWTLTPGRATHAVFRVCHLVDANGDTVAVYDARAKGERMASAACVRLLSSGRWTNAALAVP